MVAGACAGTGAGAGTGVAVAVKLGAWLGECVFAFFAGWVAGADGDLGLGDDLAGTTHSCPRLPCWARFSFVWRSSLLGEVCASDDSAAGAGAAAVAEAVAIDFLFLELARLRFFFCLPSVSAGVAATGAAAELELVPSIAAEEADMARSIAVLAFCGDDLRFGKGDA